MDKNITTKPSKREVIMNAAQSAFLELGYEGSSMGEITRRAGVSKGTVYNYFSEKSELFRSVVESQCEKQTQMLFKLTPQSEQVKPALEQIAFNYITFLLSDFAQNMYRTAVAEAIRFPELSRIFFDSGPDLGNRRLCEYLATMHGKGKLLIDDIDLAALQFTELCKADLFMKRVLNIKESFKDEDIKRIAKGAVKVFLAAYGVR